MRFPSSKTSSGDVGFHALWEEAKLNIITELRLGVHPVLLQQEFEDELYGPVASQQHGTIDSLSLKMLTNLRNAGQFDDMPGLREYQRKRDDPVWLARFEVQMCEMFDNRYMGQFGTNVEISRKLGNTSHSVYLWIKLMPW